MDFLVNLCAENLAMSLIFIIFAAMKLKLKEGFRGERKIVLPPQVVEMEEQDPLMQGLHITDIGFYPRASHHYCQRREPISAHVLIYCVDGRGWYRIGDEAELHVGRDQYFILPAGRPHVYGSDDAEPWTIYWLHFKGSQADVYADGAAAPSDVRPSLQSRISDRGQLFEEIFSTLEYGFGRENLRYASTMLHHYLGTMRYLQQFRLADIRRPNSENDVVAAAIHYMRENLEHRLTLSDLSRFTGYSPSYFSNIFKHQTGHSPLNYFSMMKVQRVCQLLDQTDMRLNQICFKVGIDDSYYLSRLFSKQMGMSPTEYRQRRGVGGRLMVDG